MWEKICALLAGVFCIFGAIYGKEWFLRGAKARLFVKLFGEEGAQKFYIILGVILIVLGLLI